MTMISIDSTFEMRLLLVRLIYPEGRIRWIISLTDTNFKRLKGTWDQNQVPVVLRRGGRGEKLRVRLPFSTENGAWLQNGRRSNPLWNNQHKCWEIPKAWFSDLVERALEKYSRIYVIQPYREQEICARSCREAKSHECQCSCMGINHGQGEDGTWFDVGEAFSTRLGQRNLACRLMRKI